MKLFKKLSDTDTAELLSSAASRAAHGRVVSSKFFRKYFIQTTFIVSLTMVYISNRYDCVTGMESIAALQSELAIEKTELQNQRSAYMSATRESAMQELVDTLHLRLGIQQQPPYVIHYSDGR